MSRTKVNRRYSKTPSRAVGWSGGSVPNHSETTDQRARYQQQHSKKYSVKNGISIAEITAQLKPKPNMH